MNVFALEIQGLATDQLGCLIQMLEMELLTFSLFAVNDLLHELFQRVNLKVFRSLSFGLFFSY